MGPWSHLWYVGKLESEPVRLHSLSAYPLPCSAPCWEDQVSEGKLSGPVSGYSSLAFPPKNSHFASASELNNRAVPICLWLYYSIFTPGRYKMCLKFCVHSSWFRRVLSKGFQGKELMRNDWKNG